MPAILDQPRRQHHKTPRPDRTPRRRIRQRRNHRIKQTWDNANRTAYVASTAQPVAQPRPQTSRQRKSRLGKFFSEFTFEKTFTIFSLLVATSLIVLCSLDLALAWPWKHASLLFDWTYLAVGFAMMWLTYNVFKDQTR